MNLLDVSSLFQRVFKKYITELINVWMSLGIEPWSACLTRKHSATDL